MAANNLDPIQTIVMMDFETTGLIPGDSRDPLEKPPIPVDTPVKMPRITEFSFISIPRTNFIDGVKKMQSKYNLFEDEAQGDIFVQIPLNVHTRQVCPQLTETQWFDYEVNRRNCDAIKLSRFDLKHKNLFAEEWPGVIQFLNTLRKPAVIVAHNGVKFDFRILYSELKFYDLLDKYPIPDGIYFLDSYITFLDLEKEYHDCAKLATNLVDWTKINKLIQISSKKDGHEESSIREEDNTNVQPMNIQPKEEPIASISERVVHEDNVQILVAANPSNQITPPRSFAKRSLFTDESKSDPIKKRRKICFDIEHDNHPLNFMRTNEWSPAKKRRLKRMFFERVETEDWKFSNFAAREYFFGRKGNFKLANMYNELVNKDFQSHRAQEDCEALLQVCLAFGKDFLDYADKNRAEFPFLMGKDVVWPGNVEKKMHDTTNVDVINLIHPVIHIE